MDQQVYMEQLLCNTDLIYNTQWCIFIQDSDVYIFALLSQAGYLPMFT